jgi:copper chaperone NosL
VSALARLAVALGLALAACAPATLGPAPLDTRNDACAWCRMAVSTPRFAGQLVVSGEEPRFFDDLGCLAAYVERNGAPGRRWAAWVADHRTGEWVAAGLAVYTHVPALDTPMSSHLVAHAGAASRDQDPEARGGTPVAFATLLPRLQPSGGGR